MQYFNFNGRLYQNDTPVIGADSRGLRYGDGIFETIKYVNGQLLLADAHFARLWKGMQVLQFEIPKHFTPEKLQQEIEALVKKNGHQHKVRVRITILRGAGGIFDPVNNVPNYILQTWQLPPATGDWNSNGLVLGIYTGAKKSCDILSNLKHNNSLPYVMAAMEAKKQRWNDALVLNSYDRVCETSIANIFYCKDETLYTPALSEGCVAGITRQYLIQELKVQGISVTETTVTTAAISEADEIFITNAIAGIRWVQELGGKQYGNAFTNKIFTLLKTIS